MKYWTWAEIREKIEAECDLEDEDFVRTNELMEYGNEAVDEAESEIHTLYEDYFLKYVDQPVVANDEFFDMPTVLPDIYADKIREIIFRQGDGTTTYTVNRLRDWKKFKQKALSDSQTSTDLYSYFLLNQTAGNPQIMLVPKAHEAGTMRIWYLRNANRFVDDDSICDIPEFVHFVIAFIKYKVMFKEGHPGLQDAATALESQRASMNATLMSRVPDAENEVEMDVGAYEDMN